MKLSSKSHYAIKAMLQLALAEGDNPVSLAAITEAQGISISYLEQLFASLRQHGLVEGIRGPGGGYQLAKPAREISVTDIVTSVDFKAYVRRPANTLSAYDTERSQYYEMWGDLSDRLYMFLHDISLSDLLTEHAADGALPGLMTENRAVAGAASRAA